VVSATDESVLMMDVEEEEDAPVKAPPSNASAANFVAVAFQSVAHTRINIIITAHTFHHYATFSGFAPFFLVCLLQTNQGQTTGVV
jgi:hypothetical protein